MDEAAVAVRGDLLSCYTTAIAGYLASAGLDPMAVLAPQWHLGIRGNCPAELEFQHYHTSLLGDGACYRLDLAPRRAASAAEAHAAIAEEVRRSGTAIVMADTELLPWLVTYEKSSAPHWLLVDGVRSDGALHVCDRFEWIDDTGQQRASRHWLDAAGVRTLEYRSHLERSRRYRLRERWAFGEEMPPPPAPAGEAGSWRWFERTGREHGSQAPDLLAEGLRLRSFGQLPPGAEGELRGGAAIRHLAAVLKPALADPQAYELTNDLWVIGRTRELFLTWLTGGEGRRRPWDASRRRAIEEVVAKWNLVARFMHYNAAVVDRGREPRTSVLELLWELAALEDGLDPLGPLKSR